MSQEILFVRRRKEQLRMKPGKILAVITGVFVSTILAFAGCVFAFLYVLSGDAPCVNEIIKTEMSPGGSYQAVVFTDTGGGATVDFYTHVAILAKGQNLSAGDQLKNVHSVFRGYHKRYTDVTWKDNKTLIIHYSCKETDVIKKETKKDDIEIQYVSQGY